MENCHIAPELIKAARKMQGKFNLGSDFSAGGCAAAVCSASGRIFTGICIDISCGIGFCAEHAAIAEMLKSRETKIEAIVAVGNNGIIPPCGRCREMMAQINRENLDCSVIVDSDTMLPLRKLLPNYWIS